MILKTAQTNIVAVVIINHQMQYSHNILFGSNGILIGGYIMSYASTYRIHLRNISSEEFCTKLDISPSYPQQRQTLQ